MTKTAVVIGGGIAGTVAAIALHRAGWEPEIHEARAEDADERGAFLTLAENGLAALRLLGLDPAEVMAAGYPTPRLLLGNGAGRHLADLPLGGSGTDGTTTTTIRRGDLYAALRAAAVEDGIPIRYGHKLAGLDGGVATFANGDRAAGDLVVGADGLHSRTRKILDPGAPGPRYLGVLNVAGFTAGPIDADLDPTPGVVHMTFGRRSFFGWSLDPAGSAWWFANPPAKRPHTGAPPAGYRQTMIDLFAGDATPAAAIIRATPEVLGPWNTYDLPRVPVWHDDRTVLLGDAAHAASPSSGQGASMAIEDAVTLGRCLASSSSIADGLADYEQMRRKRVQKVVAAGRRNGSGKAAGPIGAAIRDAMMPAMMRMLYRKGNPQAWIVDHRL
ncbi:NAD(P)/FAD-dependent oxidoreductase [Actinoplanes sp. NPDC051633]|uniref:FAD-dependent oxidoreductase n=1 Tax=Actinoplanes sp. NPDC051633 TaxID=3155670 RepID=UPI0034441B8E